MLVNTRRPEVDIPASASAPPVAYHYDGTGGIELSSWVRRAVFALALGSKELLLSDDITPESRILLHRDVHDRLRTLAPFIQWDSDAVPLTADGRIVFVVDGYTTSENYPYAERVDLGGTSVNYARASVRATVDAFSGRGRPLPDRRVRAHRPRLGGDLPDPVPPRRTRCPPSCATGSATRPTSSTPRRRRTRRSTPPGPTCS